MKSVRNTLTEYLLWNRLKIRFLNIYTFTKLPIVDKIFFFKKPGPRFYRYQNFGPKIEDFKIFWLKIYKPDPCLRCSKKKKCFNVPEPRAQQLLWGQYWTESFWRLTCNPSCDDYLNSVQFSRCFPNGARTVFLIVSSDEESYNHCYQPLSVTRILPVINFVRSFVANEFADRDEFSRNFRSYATKIRNYCLRFTVRWFKYAIFFFFIRSSISISSRQGLGGSLAS